jgi:hypothetical protein
MNDQITEDERQLFESYFRELEQQEAAGIVQASVVIETILTAWALRNRLYRFRNDPVREKILKVEEIAKKYGYSKLWNARMFGTLNSRVQKLEGKEGSLIPKKHHCGCCGRAIWNPLSVKRGIGPVCWHKRGS